MSPPLPHVCQAGAGPGVVCLHANASNAGQWRGLMSILSTQFQVSAIDSHGAGQGPPWPTDRRLGLHDEVALLEPVFAAAGSAVVLVGHSYGAAVALKAALMHPGRVRALALYEPTLFGLLDADSPAPNAADGIRDAVADCEAALASGDAPAAACIFIDYWMGAGSWAAMPPARRPAIVAAIANIGGWSRALFGEPASRADLATIDVPVLLMTGSQSTASSLGVARLLERTLPRCRTQAFAGLGHMGPVTHPETVNAAIAHFLDTCRSPSTAPVPTA